MNLIDSYQVIMETTFDFTTALNKYTMNMDASTILYIITISNSVAMLYFTDEAGKKINIPNGIVIYQYDYENVNKKVKMSHINHYYPLCWTDNYTVEWNTNVLLSIQNQRKWNIIS